MTTATVSLRFDVKVTGLVSGAHGLSHFYHLCIPPLFPLLKEELGVSYAALGAVLAVFYAVSGVMQTVAGFLVDRLGARAMLLAGMALIAIGTLLAGVVPSFAWLFVAAVVAGLGNSVFHPADLALLNGKVGAKRLAYAFSVHGIAGNIGWAAAPPFTVTIAQGYGWRAALVAAGVVGLLYFGVLATQRVLGGELRQPAPAARGGRGSLRENLGLLVSPPILLCFAFFFLYAVALVGFQTFATAALPSLHGVTQAVAATALTGLLLGGGVGILAGGYVATRTRRHEVAAAIGVGVPAGLALVIAGGGLGSGMLIAIMTLTGFLVGSIGPSRDIIVRGIAPPAARGKVYGFVYSGLDLAGMIAPLAFGWALDRGRPDVVFIGAAVFLVAAIPTVIRLGRREHASQATQAVASERMAARNEKVWPARWTSAERVRIPYPGGSFLVSRGLRGLYGASWKSNVIAALLQVKRGAFVDVGVHVGQTLLDVRSGSRDRKYVGFEPNPECFDVASRLIEWNDLTAATLVPAGLADVPGSAELYFIKGDLSFNSCGTLIRELRPGRELESRTVQVVVFDEVWKKLGPEPPGIVKIDVEGKELEVVLGMKETLRTARPIILCEVLFSDAKADLRLMQGRNRLLEGALSELGYRIFQVRKTPDGSRVAALAEIAHFENKVWTPENSGLCDYLFVQPREISDLQEALSPAALVARRA